MIKGVFGVMASADSNGPDQPACSVIRAFSVILPFGYCSINSRA